MADGKKEDATQQPEPTPLERMKELTRRIVRVPKSEVAKPKRTRPSAKRS